MTKKKQTTLKITKSNFRCHGYTLKDLRNNLINSHDVPTTLRCIEHILTEADLSNDTKIDFVYKIDLDLKNHMLKNKDVTIRKAAFKIFKLILTNSEYQSQINFGKTLSYIMQVKRFDKSVALSRDADALYKQFIDLKEDKSEINVNKKEAKEDIEALHQRERIKGVNSISEENLNYLLNQEKFKWVNNDLIPVLSLLNFNKEGYQVSEKFYRSFHFVIPFSKGNIIQNVSRITKKPESLVFDLLNEFEGSFKEYYTTENIQNLEYIYITEYGNEGKHSSKLCKLKYPNSEIFYRFSQELLDLIHNASKIEFDSTSIYEKLIKKIENVQDLIYLLIIKNGTAKCRSGKSYSFFDEAIYDLKSTFKNADLDEDFIEFCLMDNISPLYVLFRKLYEFEELKKFENIYKYLPETEKWFSLFFSHGFNTSSCGIWYNLNINSSIAKSLYSLLNSIPILNILREKYMLAKNSIDNEKRFPLFEYRDKNFEFMSKYRDKIISSYSKFYDFEIEDSEIDAIEYLKKNNIISIEDDEIILRSEEKFNSVYYRMMEKENTRIKKNKSDILSKWSSSNVNLLEHRNNDDSTEYDETPNILNNDVEFRNKFFQIGPDIKEVIEIVKDIKNHTEYIRNYLPTIESILEKTEDIELYLRERLASDYEKIKDKIEDYTQGKIEKKELAIHILKILGKKAVRIFIKKI